MKYLDCQSPDVAIQTLAEICGRPVDAVRDAIATYEPDWDLPRQDSIGPQAMLASLAVDLRGLKWDGTYYFHGTRTLDIAKFRHQGILPLGRMIDDLWAGLYELVRDEISQEQWLRYRTSMESSGEGHAGFLYRLKLHDEGLHGPYSILTRDHHLRPVQGTHNYLASPEIVEDIASVVGHGLQQRFEAIAQSCLIKFRTCGTDTCALEEACWYIHTMLRDGEPGWHGLYCGDRKGKEVPPEDIVSIEVIERGSVT
jgi:hypothetical protein